MPSQRRHELVSAVYIAILTVLVLGTANASAVRPITSGSSDSRPGDVLPLCYQLNDALSIALAGNLSSLAVLRRHLQLEQFHARRQLELELLDYEQDVTVDEDSGRDGVVDGDSDAPSEERAQELARHGEQRRQHAQAAAALTSQLRSKLQQQAAAASQAGASTSGATIRHNSSVKINSTDSRGAATAAQITAAAAAAAALLPDLRFLPQCLISRLDPSLFTSPDLPQPQLPTITPLQTAAASHLHHLGHAAQQPHTDTATTGAGAATSPHSTHAGSAGDAAASNTSGGGGASPYPPTETPSRPLVSLMVQYFNRPWMLPVLAAPFRRCSSLHAATSPPNATSFSSDEEAINRTRHLGFGIEMLINVDSRKDAAAVAEFAAGPLGAGGFVVPVYSNSVHEIRSYNRLARLARGKILVMLQDDDVFPEESACMWLSSVVRAFARWPRLGAVGSQRYVFNYHPNTTDWYVHYWDAGAGHVRVRQPPAHLLQQEQEEWQQPEEGGQEEEGQEEEGQEEGDEGAGPRRRGGARRRAVRRRQLHAQAQTPHQQGGGESIVVDTSDQQQQQQQQQRLQSRRLQQQQHVDLDGRRWLQQGQGLEAQGREARMREVLEQEARLAAGQPRWRAPGGASWEDVLAASHPVSSSSSSASGASSAAASSARQQQRRRWLRRRLHRRSVLQKEEEKKEERKEAEEEEAGGGSANSAAVTAAAEDQQQQELLLPSPQQQDPAAEADPDEGPPPYEPPYIPLESYDGRLRLQFVSIIDYAPIAVRRSSFLAVGGIDENMSESGACGVHSDYDLTLRMWMAGWQVAYVEVPGLGKDPAESEGGTHRHGVSGYCWERQWDQAIGYMRTRWGQRNRWDPESYYWFGSNTFEVVAEHVRLLNLQLLQPLAQPPDSYCPFGYGCGLKPVDNITGTLQQVHPPFGELSSWPKHTRVQAPWAPGWAAARARARAAAAGKHGARGERHGHGQGQGQGQGSGGGGEPQRRSGRFLRRRRRQQGHAAQEVEDVAGVGPGAGVSRVGAGGGGGVQASRGWRRLAG